MSAMVLKRAMAADDEHTKDPDFSYVFNEVTLGSVQPSFRYLTTEQQRRQMSSVFQAHGLYWVMAIEKYGSEDGQPDKCDIHVYLYCLSVPIENECRENFVIKGDICSGDHVFNGEAGRAFNLPGKSYPAEAVRFKNKVVFRLRCGDINEEVEMWAPAAEEANQDNENKFVGVWYDGKWTGGIGVCPLKNYFLDTEADIYREQIELSVKFELPAPFAVVESGLLANTEPSVIEVAKAKGGEMEMEVDEDNSTNHPLSQWEKIVNDAENCSDEDLSFNIDEVDELSDEELDIDIESDEESDDLEMKPEGYKPDISMGSLSEASKALLTWREGEFSDWKIKVLTDEEDATSTTYSIHRHMLATGPKKSGYFEALFKSESFSENSECMSTVTLPIDVAAQFSDFLDFMYCQPLESEFIVTSKNWKSMKYLADYFIVPALTDDVAKVIENDMYNIDRLEGYISEFSGICDDFTKRMIPIATPLDVR